MQNTYTYLSSTISIHAGILCGQCADGYAVTLDLLTCTPANDQCAMGLAVFLILYVVVIIIALLVLTFDTELPNELKGFVFYAQVSAHYSYTATVIMIMTSSCTRAGDWFGVSAICCTPVSVRQLHRRKCQ